MKIHHTIIGSVSDQWVFRHRDAEMSIIQQAFDRFRDGCSQVVVISRTTSDEEIFENQNITSRGIGRTRFLKEFIAGITNKQVQKSLTVKVLYKYFFQFLSTFFCLKKTAKPHIHKERYRRLELVAFLNMRHKFDGHISFHHYFVDTLINSGHTSIAIEDMWATFRSSLGRIFLIIRLSYLLFAAVIIIISSLTSMASDVGIALTINNIQNWIGSNTLETILGVLLVIIITYWEYWQNPSTVIKQQWDSHQFPKDMLQQTIISDEPGKIARIVNIHFPKSRDYLFIIDDAEEINFISYDVINAIFDVMVKAGKRVMLVWAYNLKDSQIHRSSNRIFRDLSDKGVRNKLIIELRPLIIDEIKEIVLARYGYRSISVRDFVDSMLSESCMQNIMQEGQKIPTLSGRADLIFGFLKFLEEHDKIREEEWIGDNYTKKHVWIINTFNFSEQFESFLAKDRLFVDDLVSQIENQEAVGNDCIEILKSLMVFPEGKARRDILIEVTCLNEQVFEISIAYLINKIKILSEINGIYMFSDPDTYFMFRTTVWETWNYGRAYSSRLFKLLLRKTEPRTWGYLADLALICNPSQETFVILLKTGIYLADDLGYFDYALSYLDGENGALSQWISLLHEAHTIGESILDLIKRSLLSITSYNPRGRGSDEPFTHSVNPLELCLQVGKYYWFIGKTKDAKRIWTHTWTDVKRYLADLSDTSIASKLIVIDKAIEIELAEMYFLMGEWDSFLGIWKITSRLFGTNNTISAIGSIDDKAVGEGMHRNYFMRINTDNLSSKEESNNSYYKHIKSIIQLYRLIGLNIECKIIDTPLEHPDKEINILHEQIAASLKIQEGMPLHIMLAVLRRQFLLLSHWSRGEFDGVNTDEDSLFNSNLDAGMILEALARIISTNTIDKNSRDDDGEIMISNAIIYSSIAQEAQFIINMLNKLTSFTSSQIMLLGDYEGISRIIWESNDIMVDVTDYTEEEELLLHFDDLEGIICSIMDNIVRWVGILKAIDTYILKLSTKVKALCDQTTNKIISAKKMPKEYRKNELRFMCEELHTQLSLLFQGSYDYYMGLAEENYLNAFVLFEQLIHLPGLAELFYFRAKDEEWRSLITNNTEKRKEHLEICNNYLQSSLEIRKKNGMKFRCPEAYYRLASYYEKKGYYPKAAENYEWSGYFSQSLSYPLLQIADAYMSSGIKYYNTKSISDHNKVALRSLEKALQIYTEIQQSSAISNVEYNIYNIKWLIANIYYSLSRCTEASEICQQIITHCDGTPCDTDMRIILGKTYLTMGYLCEAQDRSNTRIDYYKKAYTIFETLNNRIWMLITLEYIVRLFCDNKDVENLQKYFELLKIAYLDAKSRYTQDSDTSIILGKVARALGESTQHITDRIISEDVVCSKQYHTRKRRRKRQVHEHAIAHLEAANSHGEESLPVPATTYFEESFNFYLKIGEYYPAWEVMELLLEQWKQGKYSSDLLKKRFPDLIKTLISVNPDDKLFILTLSSVFDIFKELSGQDTQSIHYSSKDKVNCLKVAEGLLRAKKEKKALEVLMQARKLCQADEFRASQNRLSYIPESCDISIYHNLYNTYQMLGKLEDGRSAHFDYERLRALKTSAVLFQIGEYYEKQGEINIALFIYTIAGKQKPDNNFAQRARQLREKLHERKFGFKDVRLLANSNQDNDKAMIEQRFEIY